MNKIFYNRKDPITMFKKFSNQQNEWELKYFTENFEIYPFIA